MLHPIAIRLITGLPRNCGLVLSSEKMFAAFDDLTTAFVTTHISWDVPTC